MRRELPGCAGEGKRPENDSSELPELPITQPRSRESG